MHLEDHIYLTPTYVSIITFEYYINTIAQTLYVSLRCLFAIKP